MTSPPTRIGIAGVGTLTLRAVLPHLTQPDVADRLTVAAVCDHDLDRATAAAKMFDVPKAYGDLDEMLAQAELDAVTLVTPIGLHAEHGRKVLEADLHLHVNKTISTTVAEADALIKLARARDLRIVASPGEVLRPQVKAIRRLLDDGAIGRLAWGVCGCAFGVYHEEEPERTDAPGGTTIDPTWYFRKPGGGPLYDMTVYALHQLTGILGPARAVTAMSGQVLPVRSFAGAEVGVDADDNSVLLLDFGAGRFVVAYGTASAEALPGDFGATTFFGTTGTLAGLQLNGVEIDYERKERTMGASSEDWEGQMRVLDHVTGPHLEIAESHVFEDIMQLVRWVRDGVASEATAEHARHVVDIIESGYRAAETGQTQPLTTTFELAPLRP
ncbi:MAG: Gfo/Idh/MocA family protein [Ilumatobacteraceae bacterium]